jgi:hypothetical protein
MSKKLLDKNKLRKKLHKLQKQLTRSKNNPGHSEEKDTIRMVRINKLKEKIKGNNKPNNQ